MSEEKKTFTLSGKAFWAHLRQPNPQSGQYQLDLSIDDSTKSMLEGLGLTVKNAKLGIGVRTKKEDDERGNFVTLKKSSEDKEGVKYNPPKIVDSKNNILPDNTLIGNGSLVNVKARVYDWNFKGKSGKSLGFSAVQITSLVEYSQAEAFEETEGFTIKETTSESSSSPFSFDE